MPDFLETSFDLPKTEKVPLNALIFLSTGNLVCLLTKRKNKNFIQDSFFWRFSILTRRLERRARWCNRRRLQKKSWQKVSSDQYQQLSFLGPSLKRPVGPPRARGVKAIFCNISDFRSAICTWDLPVHMNPEPPQPKRPRISHPYEKFPVQRWS